MTIRVKKKDVREARAKRARKDVLCQELLESVTSDMVEPIFRRNHLTKEVYYYV